MTGQLNLSPSKNTSRPRAKYAAILIVLLLAAFVFTVILSEVTWQADLTGERLYSVSEHTKDVLDSLETEVNIYTLYSPGNYNKTLAGLLNTYSRSSSFVSIMNLGTGMVPQEIRSLPGLSELPYGSVIVYCKNTALYRTILPSQMYFEEDGMEYFAAENKLTAAIKYVCTGEEHKLRLLYQHREKTSSDLSPVLGELSRINIECEQYDLFSEGITGENTELILSVSPRQDFSSDEILRIKDIVSNGGTFFLLLDMAEYDLNTGITSFLDPEIPNLIGFLNELGIDLAGSMILEKDPDKTGMRPSVIEAVTTDAGLISDAAGKNAVMSECVPIIINEDADVSKLIITSPTAYGPDLKSPYCLMAGCHMGKGRVIVASSSSLLTQNSSLSNSEIINSIICSCGLSGTNAIPEKPLKPKSMTVDHGIIKMLLAVFVLLLLPGVVIILGARIIRSRKT